MPKAAIIIPIYNVENYVRKTIESAIKQTEPDIEIILVDDGSTDSSGQICDEYAEQEKCIHVIHKANGGLSSARNAGAGAATADYVMFLDGDDYLKDNAVERIYQTMQKYPCDFVQFLYQEVEEGQEPKEQIEIPKIYQAHTSKELFENLYHLGGVAASGATKLFRRELILEIPFENIQHEDEMWCTRAFQKNLTASYLLEELYCYVMNQDSFIHSKFNNRRLDVFKTIDERIATLQKLGLQSMLHFEYNKMFGRILRLYLGAKNCANDEAVNFIKRKFINEKENIKRYSTLTGKFGLLFHLLSIRFGFIELYRFYWKIKGVRNGFTEPAIL